MSRTDVTGRFNCSGCQWSPSSNETYTPLLVPAYNSPRFTGSARTTVVYSSDGKPLMIGWTREEAEKWLAPVLNYDPHKTAAIAAE